MVIEFEKMKKGTRELYEAMWKNDVLDSLNAKIDNTYNIKSRKKSDDSYTFVGNGCNAKILSEIFEIKDPGLFCDKYHMAVSGAGDEGNRILTLHSSSLCALLHFYNVTKKNPLILELTTQNGKVKRTVEFTRSVFEYKSPVINAPSNMDVVLIGEDKKNEENIVFFLESKFSEYYTDMNYHSDDISEEYRSNKYSKKLYMDESFLKRMELYYAQRPKKKFHLTTCDKKKKFYINGIKQMISHYTGIRNVLSGEGFVGWDTDERQDIVDKALVNGAVAILGEIAFKFPNSDIEQSWKKYAEKYRILAERIDVEAQKDNLDKFEIVKDLLDYSMILKSSINEYDIEDRIRLFYRENNDKS